MLISFEYHTLSLTVGLFPKVNSPIRTGMHGGHDRHDGDGI